MTYARNKLLATGGTHATLTRVIEGPDRHYGFAVTDDGSDVFVPGFILKSHNLTEADVGIGFTAVVAAPDGSGANSYRAREPVVLDGVHPDPAAGLPRLDEVHEALDAVMETLQAYGTGELKRLGRPEARLLLARLGHAQSVLNGDAQ